MKTFFKEMWFATLFTLIVHVGNSQGFINLNFENANLTGYVPLNEVPATNAFPGWIADARYFYYDNFSLSGESISIMDTNSPFFTTSIQGKYYAFFAAANFGSSLQPISLSQTGTIPAGTHSITFWGDMGGLQ